MQGNVRRRIQIDRENEEEVIGTAVEETALKVTRKRFNSEIF